MKNIKFIIVLFFTIILVGSCKKNVTTPTEFANKEEIQIPDNFFEQANVPGVTENSNYDNNALNVTSSAAAAPNSPDPNNGDDEVILGSQLTNLYTVPNMQVALNLMNGGQTQTLSANYLYVRFKPTTPEQIETLEDSEDLELQDYPMDYTVMQEGDYYQDPNLGTEDIGWLYSVVPVGYNNPSGILYEILTPLYLTDNQILEDLAESLAGGLIYSFVKNANGTVTIRNTSNGTSITMRPPNPCELLPIDDPNSCGGSGGGGGGTPPSATAGIYVEEQRACGSANTIVPLRQARVVCKRWFKIWRGYTNDIGQFTSSKKFKNKVKVIVKTKNTNAKIGKVRGIRFWQMLFPVKKRIGVFNGNELATLRYVFNKPTDGSANNKELPCWVATTTHNSVIEFKDYSTEFNLAQPPTKLKMIISNWGKESFGAAPMLNKCQTGMTYEFAQFFLLYFIFGPSNATFIINQILSTLEKRVDVMIGYKSPNYNCNLTSSLLKSTVYHELGHTQHYALVGCNFWAQYVNAITTEITKLNQSSYWPYGTGNDFNTAPIIATGEMWGNHIEKIYAERYFGNGGAASANYSSLMQGTFYGNNAATGLNANLWAIESFDPHLASDVHKWIPQGLPYDLSDTRNEFPAPFINDNVSGFTNQQCYVALQGVNSIPAYKANLLQRNGNTQVTQVNQLFNSYGY